MEKEHTSAETTSNKLNELWKTNGPYIVCGTLRIGEIFDDAARPRILSDHNACLGIEEPETTVPELVAVCDKLIVTLAERAQYQEDDELVAKARAVLAKTGKT